MLQAAPNRYARLIAASVVHGIAALGLVGILLVADGKIGGKSTAGETAAATAAFAGFFGVSLGFLLAPLHCWALRCKPLGMASWALGGVLLLWGVASTPGDPDVALIELLPIMVVTLIILRWVLPTRVRSRWICENCDGSLRDAANRGIVACPHCGHHFVWPFASPSSERKIAVTLAERRWLEARDDRLLLFATVHHLLGALALLPGMMLRDAQMSGPWWTPSSFAISAGVVLFLAMLLGLSQAVRYVAILRRKPLAPVARWVVAPSVAATLLISPFSGPWAIVAFIVIAYLGVSIAAGLLPDQFRSGICEVCGYDIRAQLSQGDLRCPECGTENDRLMHLDAAAHAPLAGQLASVESGDVGPGV